MKSILDPSFRYTPANSTDIRKTFRKVRREMAGVKLVKMPTLLVEEITIHTPSFYQLKRVK